MFTNFDAQHVVNSNQELIKAIDSLKDIKPGSGNITIPLWSLKIILEELKACRIK